MHAVLPRRTTASMELIKTQGKAHFWHFRNGDFFFVNAFQKPRFSKARVFRSRDFRCFKRNISRIVKNNTPCSAWRSQGLDEIRVKISSRFECISNEKHGRGDGTDRVQVKTSSTNAYKEHGRAECGYTGGLEGLSNPIEPSCGGGGSSSGGAGRHWGSSGGNGGDEDRDWFCQIVGDARAHLLFLLGLIFMHVKIEALIPALLLHLFLHKDLIATADGITSPLEPSLDIPTNGSKVCREQMRTCNSHEETPEPDAVFEVRGGIWRRLLIDANKDEFVGDPVKETNKEAFATEEHARSNSKKSLQGLSLERIFKWCSDLVRNLMLPDGYPSSVTRDYLDYTLWRMGQNIASQINGVLTTQALLYAVGLGKGAIPTAAAVNWVLKDGIGYLSKIILAKYGRHFDVHPKGWRLLADLIENASCALELLTPSYPHLFVYLGAAAGAGRSASGLIQAATRSCFYAGFAAQRNFAEVIAKGEAQGMVSKSIGIALGIAISSYVGASGPMLVTAFLTVTSIHMFCNLRSYQAVQLRTLNPYRASLVFSEYIRRGVVASVEEVNAEEPIFTEVPLLLFRLKGHKDRTSNVLSLQTKEDASIISTKLNLGVSFANVIGSQKEADELFKIYQDEQYVLAERQNTYQAILKVGCTSHDLLKLMLQVCYLYQLQNGGPWATGKLDSHVASPVEISYRLTVDNFDRLQQELASAGWTTSDGLVARPLPYRLLETPHQKDDRSM